MYTEVYYQFGTPKYKIENRIWCNNQGQGEDAEQSISGPKYFTKNYYKKLSPGKRKDTRQWWTTEAFCINNISDNTLVIYIFDII